MINWLKCIFLGHLLKMDKKRIIESTYINKRNGKTITTEHEEIFCHRCNMYIEV